LNAELASLHSYYGQALLFTGDADGATREFRKELALNPNDFDANLQLASILSHRGQTAEARPLLQRAVQLRPGSPEARDALQNGFPIDKPGSGDAGIAVGSPAPPIGTFPLNHLSKPTVLVFGSYTCPKLRSAAADLKRIYDQHHDRIDFRLVYIREAHAGEQWQSTVNERDGVAVAPAASLPEKQAHADLCLRKLNLPFPALVDGMDAAAETAYQAWPSRLYLIGRNGRVAFNTRLGELDFRPGDLEAAIREILTNGVPDVRPR
jgi:tetratricopeptide (TPR) repeat protein